MSETPACAESHYDLVASLPKLRRPVQRLVCICKKLLERLPCHQGVMVERSPFRASAANLHAVALHKMFPAVESCDAPLNRSGVVESPERIQAKFKPSVLQPFTDIVRKAAAQNHNPVSIRDTHPGFRKFNGSRQFHHILYIIFIFIDISHKISKIRLKNAKFAKSWGRMNFCDGEWNKHNDEWQYI